MPYRTRNGPIGGVQRVVVHGQSLAGRVYLVTALLLIAGLALLVIGGEILVRGAGGLARSFGISPLVVGLTVVSSATSAPELAVTLQATLAGTPGLAVGNVVGSNIANVLLVLGLAGLILPLAVRIPVVRRDVPVLIVFSIMLLVLSLGGSVSRTDGLILAGGLAGYVAWTVLRSRQQELALARQRAAGAPRPRGLRVPVALLLVGVGVALLVLGARWLVDAASEIAATHGMSDMVIGLTIVAVGTSLPELATSVVAAIRGNAEIAVGNAVGSCIFNIGAVMGLTAVLAPGGVPVEQGAINFDIPIMIAVAIALLPVAFTGLRIARWEAGLFVVLYAAYVTYLLLDAARAGALEEYATVMQSFVIPLTAVTLMLLALYELGVIRGRRQVLDGDADPPLA